MVSRSTALVSMALAVGLGAARASADPVGLEAALRLYQDGAFSEALEAFEAVIGAGDNDRSALATAYLHLGILRAGARDARGAELAFESALSLDPRAELPARSSPTVTEPFSAALERRHGAPALGLRLDAPGRVAVGTSIAVLVEVEGDSTQLAAEARATAKGRTTVATGPPFRLAVVAAEQGTITIDVSLHDAHGSVLAVERAVVQVVSAEPSGVATVVSRSWPTGPPARREEHEGGGSVLGSPWFWGGVALVIGGAVAIGLVATAEPDDAQFGQIRVRP